MKESNAAEHNLFKCQIKHQEIFNAFRSKVRMAIKEIGEDYHYIGFVEHWNRHVEQGIIDRKALRSIGANVILFLTLLLTCRRR